MLSKVQEEFVRYSKWHVQTGIATHLRCWHDCRIKSKVINTEIVFHTPILSVINATISINTKFMLPFVYCILMMQYVLVIWNCIALMIEIKSISLLAVELNKKIAWHIPISTMNCAHEIDIIYFHLHNLPCVISSKGFSAKQVSNICDDASTIFSPLELIIDKDNLTLLNLFSFRWWHNLINRHGLRKCFSITVSCDWMFRLVTTTYYHHVLIIIVVLNFIRIKIFFSQIIWHLQCSLSCYRGSRMPNILHFRIHPFLSHSTS